MAPAASTTATPSTKRSSGSTASRGQPFFIHMNLQSSHLPYVVPDDFPRRFSPRKIDFAIMWGKFPIDKIDIVKGRYADSLFYEDTQIARLFEYLKSHGQWDNTVFVIGGDNGEAFYEHGFSAHASSLFNEVVKVPMIIRAPGLEPGLDARPAMFLDVPPSVLAAAGPSPAPGFPGDQPLRGSTEPGSQPSTRSCRRRRRSSPRLSARGSSFSTPNGTDDITCGIR